MARVARVVKDKRVLKLMRAYLESGVMVNGVVMETEEGTPQGGPLSPLLSNVMLDDLDKELEKRGHKFVRYADDCNIYVKTQRAGGTGAGECEAVSGEEVEVEGQPEEEQSGESHESKISGVQFLEAKGEDLYSDCETHAGTLSGEDPQADQAHAFGQAGRHPAGAQSLPDRMGGILPTGRNPECIPEAG